MEKHQNIPIIAATTALLPQWCNCTLPCNICRQVFACVLNAFLFQAKEQLISSLKEFVRVNIVLAGEAISESACTKINDGDVVMVYGR